MRGNHKLHSPISAYEVSLLLSSFCKQNMRKLVQIWGLSILSFVSCYVVYYLLSEKTFIISQPTVIKSIQQPRNLLNNFARNFDTDQPGSDGAGIVAYFLMITKDEMQRAQKLLQRILVKENTYIIHLDKAMPPDSLEQGRQVISQLNETFNNIYLLQSYYISYKGISMVDVEITAMAFALNVPRRWTHFMNLSPSHYPLLTQQQMSKLLGEIPQHLSFMEARVASCGFLYQRQLPLYYDSAVGQTKESQVKLTNKAYLNRPSDLKIFKASQWKLISRYMANYLANSEDGFARRMLLYFATTLVADEHYFPTTICNSPTARDSLRVAVISYKNWDNFSEKKLIDEKSWGPNSMKVELLGQALDSGALFARKFLDDMESQFALTYVDQLLDGEQIELGNQTYTSRDVFSNVRNAIMRSIGNVTCSYMLENDHRQPCPVGSKKRKVP